MNPQQEKEKEKMMNKDQDHIVIFPFMAKGHTIPLIHFAIALSKLNVCVTFITTTANASFLREALPIDIQIIIIEFPKCPSLPPGCESTDTLPSFDLHPVFLGATTLLQQPFDKVIEKLMNMSPAPLCLVSDFFFGWTLPTCNRLNLPRVVFHGMSAFSMTLCKSLWIHMSNLPLNSESSFHVPGTPNNLLIKKNEIPDSILRCRDLNDPGTRFLSELGDTDINSWGVLVNSFAELEGAEYVTSFESFYQHGARAWLVGPLCLYLDQQMTTGEENECIKWLDAQDDRTVVYVSFGTQAHVPDEQLDEMAHGLAGSGCKFIWALKTDTWTPPEPALRNGKLVKWAPQTMVLKHKAVGGFVTHCGWNSVMEGVSAGVPMLTWPMIAEQGLNAKLVADELCIGLRLGTSSELVKREQVSEGVRELMTRENGKRVRERMVELSKKASKAVEGGGSSNMSLKMLLEELRKCKTEREVNVLAADAVQVEFRDGIQIA